MYIVGNTCLKQMNFWICEVKNNFVLIIFNERVTYSKITVIAIKKNRIALLLEFFLLNSGVIDINNILLLQLIRNIIQNNLFVIIKIWIDYFKAKYILKKKNTPVCKKAILNGHRLYKTQYKIKNGLIYGLICNVYFIQFNKFNITVSKISICFGIIYLNILHLGFIDIVHT